MPITNMRPTSEKDFLVVVPHTIYVPTMIRVNDGYRVTLVDGVPMIERPDDDPNSITFGFRNVLYDMKTALERGWAKSMVSDSLPDFINRVVGPRA